MIQNDMAIPRLSNGTMSAIVPAPSVRGHDAAIPQKRRKTMRELSLLATAHAMLKTRNIVLQTL